MRKITFLTMVAVIVAFVFYSCGNDDEGNVPESESLKFRATLGDLTKASGANWDTNDPIGVYMVKNGQALSEASVLGANVKHITGGGSPAIFVAVNPLTYPADGTEVDFISYYCYCESIDNYTYAVDVFDQTSQHLDLIYGKTEKLSKADPATVDMAFAHRLAKVSFAINNGSVASLDGLTVTLSGLLTKSSFSLDNATLTDEAGSGADITARATSNNGSVAACEAIILPVAGTSSVSVKFSVGGKDYVHHFDNGTTFEGGKNYTYTVTFEANQTLTIEGDITDWTTVPGGNITPGENGGDPGLTFGTPAFSPALKAGQAIVDGKISIPYQNAAGTENYSVTAGVSGAGAAGISVSPVAFSLTEGAGIVEIPVTGTPTTEGSVTFTINGIGELTNNTVTVTVAAAGSGGSYPAGTLASWDFTATNTASLPIYSTKITDLLGAAAELNTVGLNSIHFTGTDGTIYINGFDSSELTGHYWRFELPLQKTISAGMNIGISFSAFGSGTAPKNYYWEISVDNTDWTTVDSYSLTGSKANITVKSYTVQAEISSDTVYIRLRPKDNVAIGGSTFTSLGNSRLAAVKISLSE